jgi:hypothetical protein
MRIDHPAKMIHVQPQLMAIPRTRPCASKLAKRGWSLRRRSPSGLCM